MTADTTLRKLTEQMYDGINSFLFEVNDYRTQTAIKSMLQTQIGYIAAMYNIEVDLEWIGIKRCEDPRVLEVNDYTVSVLRTINELVQKEDDTIENDARAIDEYLKKRGL